MIQNHILEDFQLDQIIQQDHQTISDHFSQHIYQFNFKNTDEQFYIQQFLTPNSKLQKQNRYSETLEPKKDKFQVQVQDDEFQNILNQQQAFIHYLDSKDKQEKVQNMNLQKSRYHFREPSVFHNFQKHLIIALKSLVEIDSFDGQKEKIIIAKMFWKIFKGSTVISKQILHYMLGKQNQHRFNPNTLKRFGFKFIYDNFELDSINQAKQYLRQQTLKQIRQNDMGAYADHRRIKNKQNFIKYIKIFVNELEEGFLKKRIRNFQPHNY